MHRYAKSARGAGWPVALTGRRRWLAEGSGSEGNSRVHQALALGVLALAHVCLYPCLFVLFIFEHISFHVRMSGGRLKLVLDTESQNEDLNTTTTYHRKRMNIRGS